MRVSTKLVVWALIAPLAFSTPVAAESHGVDSPEASLETAGQAAPPAHVNSSPEAYVAMQGLPADQPLHMLNMIRFNEVAVYEEGSEFAAKGWSGQQAYAEYSRYSSPIAGRAGGEVAYFGMPQLTLIGPKHEKWDAIFIVTYPNLASFLALVGDPEYKKHAFHRSAAIADSRLIRMAPAQVPQ